MIYIIQIIAIQFAITLAKHDAPAVLKFEENGVTSKAMAKFHRYNVWVKIFFCLLAATALAWEWRAMVFSGTLSALWIYLVFDIALNKERPGRSWDYIGSNDADGRRWIKVFGKNAGEMKAIILLLLIIAANIVRALI